jgi:6-pyruvoyltetrahydropterin/6-carboxytetrahydropterin synthase
VIAVTRRYSFPAAHVLARPDFSEAENERVYGKCANPGGHGHDYGVEVTVSGTVDARTGQIIGPELLDEIFDETVRQRFSHTLLNDDPLFSDQVPTAENIARVVYAALAEPVAERGGSGARLHAVRIVETRRNSFRYEPKGDGAIDDGVPE